MTRLLHRIKGSFFSSEAAVAAEKSDANLCVECLEERQVLNATSWFDAYHRADVSAVQQERLQDGVSFAISATHRLTEFVGGVTLHPDKYTGAVAGGFASDIDAGRDFAGHAQVVVHGMGNTVSVYNVVTGWQNISFKSRYGARVWQVSAGNTGEIYMLDNSHNAWRFESKTDFSSTGGWRLLGIGFSEIQASRSAFSPGLFARTDAGVIGHYTSSGWEFLGSSVRAHALSVNANNSVFIIGADLHAYQYNWVTKGWRDLEGENIVAINACTGVNGADLLYAAVGTAPDSGNLEGHFNTGLGFNSGGTGRPSAFELYKFTGGAWQDLLGINSDQFSGASGTTFYYGQLYDTDLSPFAHRHDWMTMDDVELGTIWL